LKWLYIYAKIYIKKQIKQTNSSRPFFMETGQVPSQCVILGQVLPGSLQLCQIRYQSRKDQTGYRHICCLVQIRLRHYHPFIKDGPHNNWFLYGFLHVFFRCCLICILICILIVIIVFNHYFNIFFFVFVFFCCLLSNRK